MKFHNRRG